MRLSGNIDKAVYVMSLIFEEANEQLEDAGQAHTGIDGADDGRSFIARDWRFVYH